MITLFEPEWTLISSQHVRQGTCWTGNVFNNLLKFVQSVQIAARLPSSRARTGEGRLKAGRCVIDWLPSGGKAVDLRRGLPPVCCRGRRQANSAFDFRSDSTPRLCVDPGGAM